MTQLLYGGGQTCFKMYMINSNTNTTTNNNDDDDDDDVG